MSTVCLSKIGTVKPGWFAISTINVAELDGKLVTAVLSEAMEIAGKQVKDALGRNAVTFNGQPKNLMDMKLVKALRWNMRCMASSLWSK